jgi:hypothetical protein
VWNLLPRINGRMSAEGAQERVLRSRPGIEMGQ